VQGAGVAAGVQGKINQDVDAHHVKKSGTCSQARKRRQ
jgi:uncharacterized membrane protein